MEVCILFFVALFASANAEPVAPALPVEISSKIPWLQNELRPDGSLAFRYGKYFLGLNKSSPIDQHCTTPYTKKDGFCKLLKDCEVVYSELKDSNEFRRHACDIHIGRKRRIQFKRLRDSSNPFEISNERFIKLYRLNKVAAIQLINEMEEFNNDISRQDTIPLYLSVLASLNFYGHGSYQTSVGEHVNLAMSQSSISRSINKVSNIFTMHMLRRYVKFPLTNDEINLAKQGFLNILNFPNTLGAIDGTHVAIVSPKIEDPIQPAVVYLNRKGYHSINVQVICNANLVLLNINALYPGSTHDAAIWETSTVHRHLKERYNNGERNTWLIGDSGYPVQPWMMTPIPDARPNSPEAQYTKRQCSARNVVERCIGVLKQRFRCLLKSRELYYTHAAAGRIIYACAVLHNICRKYNIPDVTDEYEEGDDEDDMEPPNEEGNDINVLTEGRLVRRGLIQLILNE